MFNVGLTYEHELPPAMLKSGQPLAVEHSTLGISGEFASNDSTGNDNMYKLLKQ